MIKHYINFHKLLNYRYKEDNIMAITKGRVIKIKKTP